MHPNETFFETENVTSLNEEEKLSCEGIVSEDGCLRTLKEFKNCNSPGTDGLSAEFYKFCWTETVPISWEASTTPSKPERSPLAKDAGS